MKSRFGVFPLAVVGFVMAGCASDSTDNSLVNTLDCAVGTPREDCKPGTLGHQAAMDKMRITQMTSGIDDARCQSYGFEPGSPKYTQCRAKLDGMRVPVGQ